jgi:hypothetical protein
MKAFGFSTSDTGDAFTFSSTTYKSSTERKFFPLKETEATTNVTKKYRRYFLMKGKYYEMKEPK